MASNEVVLKFCSENSTETHCEIENQCQELLSYSHGLHTQTHPITTNSQELLKTGLEFCPMEK